MYLAKEASLIMAWKYEVDRNIQKNKYESTYILVNQNKDYMINSYIMNN